MLTITGKGGGEGIQLIALGHIYITWVPAAQSSWKIGQLLHKERRFRLPSINFEVFWRLIVSGRVMFDESGTSHHTPMSPFKGILNARLETIPENIYLETGPLFIASFKGWQVPLLSVKLTAKAIANRWLEDEEVSFPCGIRQIRRCFCCLFQGGWNILEQSNEAFQTEIPKRVTTNGKDWHLHSGVIQGRVGPYQL